jgi:hypothetical protein
MPSKGISIHIGLNHVDPNAYGGWDGALAGCLNDATDMKAMADNLGFTSTMITESDATADNVVAAIGRAAEELVDGDILWITYSGHGSQVPDVNSDEVDGKDETWVLWDRQLVDDELYALWAQFAAGVRIIMLSDSCHSGTMARVLAAFTELPPVRRSERDAFVDIRKTLQLLVPHQATPSKPNERPGPPVPVDPKRVKLMPSDVRAVVNREHAVENAARQYVAGRSERAEIGASVILISGCQDHQTSLDGTANGLFTENLKAVWSDPAFHGGYKEFHAAIVNRMPSNQQPNYYTVGRPFPKFEAQAPFTIASPAGQAQPAPSPAPTEEEQPGGGAAGGGGSGEPPAGSGKRPTLKRGDKGIYVKELQQYLLNWEFNVDVDSIFGPKTEGAVRSFQSGQDLPASGVVDAPTWDALD